MNIDPSKMYRIWYEDEQGNKWVPSLNDNKVNPPEGYIFYHTEFPCELIHKVSNRVKQKPRFRLRKRDRNKEDDTFVYTPFFSFRTTFSNKVSQETIVAMVNSGEFTLEEAIWAYSNACSRCMNVLIHKYLPDSNEGFEEFGDEWKSCTTSCSFCKDTAHM